MIMPKNANVINSGKIRRVCIELSEHKGANISPPYCNKMFIFGKKAFFIMLCLISNQFWVIFHFNAIYLILKLLAQYQ